MSEYWFNTKTGQVETDVDRSQSKDLLGPYASQAEAARALQTAHEKTEQWDEADRKWSEGED